MFEVRAATAGIRYDRIELLRRELINLFAGQLLRQFPFAIVSMKRAAAELLGRRDDFASVANQHFNGVAIDIAEHQVLSATNQHRHSVTPDTAGVSDR